MKNGEVCKFIKKSQKNKEYLADKCVREGYGQSSGGYLISSSNKKIKTDTPSQKEHFLSYYGVKGKPDKFPSYNYLRCPQLLLFIAEVAGVSQNRLEQACEILKKYENDKGLRYTTEKNGNYIWKEHEFKELKKQLQISQLVKIIREENNWKKVQIRAKEL